MPGKKGSITIFSLFSLLLITATLFALLEGTRYQEIQRLACMQTDMALESTFSNYEQNLWQQYRLLGMKSEEANGILTRVADIKAEGNGVNLLRFGMESASISSKTLLTDGKGRIFINAVSSYMKDNILYESAKGLYNQYESIQQLLKKSGVDLNAVDEALEELDRIEKDSGKRTYARAVIPDILKMAQGWKNNLVLGLYVEDTNKISDLKVDLKNDLFHRRLDSGDGIYTGNTDWLDRILLQQYLLTYLSNYESEKQEHALSYEAEYLIGRKDSDKENLMAVISRILAMREAANFTYLLSNPTKVKQAHAMAVAMGGITLNPIVIEVIHIGILTAWSIGESILDVRGLLAGKRIPLIKSSSTWTLELKNIALVGQGFLTAKESNAGLSYKDYLGVLLLLEEESQLAMRAMNVQEQTIRKLSDNAGFAMDSLIVEAEAEINYEYSRIFPFLSVVDAQERGIYKLKTKRKYGYY